MLSAKKHLQFKHLQFPFSSLVRATNSFGVTTKIGEGATGEVFSGNLNAERVAVKRLKLGANATPELRAELERRFEAEYAVLTQYNHVRLVRLIGHAVDENPSSQHPFALVFELLEEGSLADWLPGPDGSPAPKAAEGRGPLSATDRIDIVLGTAAGLAFLHGLREPGEVEGSAAQPVLHRDVKSANIGLTRRGALAALYAKLLDYGLAKAIRGEGGGGAAVAKGSVSFTGGFVSGTVGYTAPELVRGHYTVQSEVYSFGVVLLEVLLGRRVNADTATRALEAEEDKGAGTLAKQADAVWSAAAVAALASLVLDCIKVRGSKRPQGMTVVMARLKVHQTPSPLLYLSTQILTATLQLVIFAGNPWPRCRTA